MRNTKLFPESPLNLLLERFATTKQCNDYLVKLWYGGIPHCTKCKSPKSKEYKEGRERMCRHCKTRYSIYARTALHGRRLDVRFLIHAILTYYTDRSGGYTACMAARNYGVTPKSGWLQWMRIACAAALDPIDKITGMVELDTSPTGGKNLNRPMSKRVADNTDKVNVLRIFSRNTKKSINIALADLDPEKIAIICQTFIDPSATIITDFGHEFSLLNTVFKTHFIINKKSPVNRFVDGEVYVQNCEGHFSKLDLFLDCRRGVNLKHLNRYLKWITFLEYHQRRLTPEQFLDHVLMLLKNTRTTYKELTGKTVALYPGAPLIDYSETGKRRLKYPRRNQAA